MHLIIQNTVVKIYVV